MKLGAGMLRSSSLLATALAITAVLGVAQDSTVEDYSKAHIRTERIGGDFFLLAGAGAGCSRCRNVGALVGPDGVLLVDDSFAPLSEKIATAVRQIADTQIRFLVNTHAHIDHTGGNENFGKMGVTIIARDEVRARLAQPAPAAMPKSSEGMFYLRGPRDTRPPAPPPALPAITYRGSMTLHLNGEHVELIPVLNAHTDGDTMIHFPKADVLMTGDVFRSSDYPNIDRVYEGSLKGMIEGLRSAINLVGPTTKIVPGHGPVVSKAALAAYLEMIVTIRDRVGTMMKSGRTATEVIAAHPTADYDAQFVEATQEIADRFVGQVYAELEEGKEATAAKI